MCPFMWPDRGDEFTFLDAICDVHFLFAGLQNKRLTIVLLLQLSCCLGAGLANVFKVLLGK